MEHKPEFISILKGYQRNEITEHLIYLKLAKTLKSEEKRKIVEQIAKDEKAHYEFWKNITNTEVKPNRIKVLFYSLIILIYGINRGVKLMEKGEQNAQANYTATILNVPQYQWIIDDELSHESKLISLFKSN
jgi:vacuolar iron transporter family protein